MNPMTFSELTANCTQTERVALAFYLGAIRYRNTIMGLVPQGAMVNPHIQADVPKLCGACGARLDTTFADGRPYVFHRPGCPLS